MKVILVLPYLTRIGVAARYAWELGEFLIDKGDDVTIISLYTDRKLYNSEKIKIINLADTTYLPQSIKFWLNLHDIRKKLSIKNSPNSHAYLAAPPILVRYGKTRITFMIFH